MVKVLNVISSDKSDGTVWHVTEITESYTDKYYSDYYDVTQSCDYLNYCSKTYKGVERWTT